MLELARIERGRGAETRCYPSVRVMCVLSSSFAKMSLKAVVDLCVIGVVLFCLEGVDDRDEILTRGRRGWLGRPG